MGWCIRLRGAIVLVLAALSGACQTAPEPQAMPRAAESSAPGTFVFGRVQVTAADRPESWNSQAFRLILFAEGSKVPFTHRLQGDGSFEWPLAPGRYTIAEWEWIKGGGRVERGLVSAAFMVAERAEAAYIGTLAVRISGPQRVTGVADHYVEAKARLGDRLPASQTAPTRRLMTLQPGLDGVLGADICDPVWQVTCTEVYQGVTPVDPVSEAMTFPAVASRRPTLQWQPSARGDVTYDVVVYEALTYERNGKTRYIHGPIVDFASGLAAPSYGLRAPLAPATNHLWTVRLRDGNEVSTWSSVTHETFVFLLLAFSSKKATGLHFNFKTP